MGEFNGSRQPHLSCVPHDLGVVKDVPSDNVGKRFLCKWADVETDCHVTLCAISQLSQLVEHLKSEPQLPGVVEQIGVWPWQAGGVRIVEGR
eukprot:5264162-Amphidinium_carterae.1